MQQLRLKLICHASTDDARRSAFERDVPLDTLARKQLSGTRFVPALRTPVFTSPARRARETSDALCLPAQVEPALRDLDCGCWVGKTLEEIRAAEPESLKFWLTDLHAAPHGGESIYALIERLADWLSSLDGLNGPIIAVTHAAVIKAVIAYSVAKNIDAFWRVDVAPLSLVSLKRKHGGWAISELKPLSARDHG